MVPEDVFPRRRQDLAAVQARGEVRREQRPDAQAAQELRAPGQLAVVAGGREEEEEEVGHDERPEERDGAEHEEGGDADGDRDGVPEDGEHLQAPLEGDVEGREADPESIERESGQLVCSFWERKMLSWK